MPFRARSYTGGMANSEAPSTGIRVPIELGDRAYDILIGSGLLDQPDAWDGLPKASERRHRQQRHRGAALRTPARVRAGAALPEPVAHRAARW